MADGREDERATFQFIDEVQNCTDLWEYYGTRDKQKKLLDERVVRYRGQISNDIRFRWNLNNIPAQLFVSATALRLQGWIFANLACVVILREFDAWMHEFANLSFPCEGRFSFP